MQNSSFNNFLSEGKYSNRLKKDEWVVLPISLMTARLLIDKFHYAKSATNTGVYTHGLFRKGEEFFEAQCLGVAWWLPPTKAAAIATYPDGDWRKVLSLTRLVVADGVPKNACSFMLSKSIKMIDIDKWECLVTYADTWQKHEGTIYKATNWEYVGLTKPSPVFVNERGKMMGRKRGGKNIKKSEMLANGFVNKGEHSKHKFRMILKKSKREGNFLKSFSSTKVN